MDQMRLIIAIVLSVIIFAVWQMFFVDKEAMQKPAPETQAPAAKTETVKKTQPYSPKTEKQATSEIADAGISAAQPEEASRIITVDAPLYRVRLSEKGAGFTSFVLKKYREQVDENAPLKQLIVQGDAVESVLLGFAGNSLPGLDSAIFSTQLKTDTLNVTDGAQKIIFSWQSPRGVVVEKTYTFKPDSYVIDLDVNVKNGSDQPLKDRLYVALVDGLPGEGSRYGFVGPSALINDKLKQIKIKKIEEQNTYTGKLQWIALQGRYFMSGLIADKPSEASMQLFLKSEKFIESRYVMPETTFAPATRTQYSYRLYFGPMSMKILGTVGDNLKKIINFGMFDILAKPLVWLMNFLYRFIPNYGVAIIILTILTKILLWPLGSKSYKSMAEMKKIQPLMKEIREKYKNDKKKMNEEVMGLYRTYKINPLGGCLPMVVQIPVFFALYRMLYQSIELRHAPFLLWINDLSAPDRLFHFNFSIPFMQPPIGIPVLTIIMGVTMLLQQKMSPPMGDPAQAKMMMLMPVIFTVIFVNFPAGLVLYWLVNNILSISQQYYIQKKFA